MKQVMQQGSGWLKQNGEFVEVYWCVVCNKALPVVDGVVVHDDVPHPESMDFAEERIPQ